MQFTTTSPEKIAITILAFIFVNILVCLFFWRKSKAEMGFMSFIHYSLNLSAKMLYARPDEIHLFDHPSVKMARIVCAALSFAVIAAYFALFR
jgi:uncharacterized membrane-anchored protein YitT (DUF2179 family)